MLRADRSYDLMDDLSGQLDLFAEHVAGFNQLVAHSAVKLVCVRPVQTRTQTQLEVPTSRRPLFSTAEELPTDTLTPHATSTTTPPISA